MIDCGEGTQIRMRKFRVNPTRIHHIFISHLHGDHVFGLFGLLSSMGMMGRTAAVDLYGPENLRKMVESHLLFFGPPAFGLRFHTPGRENAFRVFEDEKVTVDAIPLRHRIPAFGYLFREKPRLLNIRKEKIGECGLGVAEVVRIKRGEDHVTEDGRVIPNRELTLPPYRRRSYAYISDTAYDPSIAEQVRGVDILFHEATFSGRDEKLARETMHSTTVQAARIAREAGAGRLLIGHFSTRYKDHSPLVEEARELFENTEGVNDGDTFSIPQQRETPE